MKERPILFSGPMVRAILGGYKTQTRRIVRAADLSLDPCSHDYAVKGETLTEGGKFGAVFFGDRGSSRLLPCPYGAPGDRLWVRETFAIETNRETDSPDRYPPPFKDGRPVKWHEDQEWGRWWQQCHYRATESSHDLCTIDGDEDDCGKWRPSIFMPRWASRITLEVTGVRVERLHQLSPEDAQAEGVDPFPILAGEHEKAGYRRSFMSLWDQINGKRAPWESNPWVWVVSFRRLP